MKFTPEVLFFVVNSSEVCLANPLNQIFMDQSVKRAKKLAGWAAHPMCNKVRNNVSV